MHVHYHVPAAFVGGAERQFQYLIKYLRRLDPDFSPTITYEYAALAPFIAKLDAPHTHTPDRKSLLRAMSRRQPDVLQFYTSPLMARALPYLARKPRVIEVVHNKNQFPGDLTCYPHDHTWAGVCVSPDAEDFILAHCPSMKTVVIPNGVDKEQFYPLEDCRSKKPVVGFAGRLCPDKGIDALIEIADKLPCRLELVGRDFGKYSGAHPNITRFEHTDHPEDFYRRWWAFVSTSPHESFGLAIAEAMACGCPPVMLHCGGITSFLDDGWHGHITRSTNNIPALVQGVIEHGGLHPLDIDFSAETMARAYLEVYRERPALAVETRKAPVQAAKIFKPVVGRPRHENGVVGVTPRGWYGVVRALAGCCDAYAPPEEAVHLITEEKPGLVILGCFMNEWLPICEAAHNVGAKVVATWHASYILNEFDNINRKWMAELLTAYKAKQVDYLATPHRGLAESWNHFGYETSYFPNIIDRELGSETPAKLDGINIGILGSAQTWKNMECQIVAAAMVEGATIHVQELKYPEVLRRLGILNRIAIHPKTLTDAEYYRLLGGMTVNMCVSLSEVYSYLTAESFLLGTPVLASSINPLVRDDHMAVDRFEDPSYLSERLKDIIDLGKNGEWHWLRDYMLKTDKDHRDICENTMKRWT